jgi:hypothetical protein
VLIWAKLNGCPWDATTCSAAAEGGHLEVLQWARGHRHESESLIKELESTITPARPGFATMTRARIETCGWDEGTCEAAAGAGHLEVLQWARANGCSWNCFSASAAAGGGHLAVLQWALGNGCPRGHGPLASRAICTEAAAYGHLALLQWARANGCDWGQGVCSAAASGEHLEVRETLVRPCLARETLEPRTVTSPWCRALIGPAPARRCSGRGRTAARGARRTARMRPRAATPRYRSVVPSLM